MPDYSDPDAQLQADIARLRAAKGINLRLWFRANKRLVLVFVGYLAVIAAVAGVFQWQGEPLGAGVLAGVFIAPLVALRIYVRSSWRRR